MWRNVLITAASRRVPLVEAFERALAPWGGSVIVTDVNPLSPAVYAADRAYRVPMASDPAYLKEVLAIAVAVSPYATTLVCHDKFETCRTLRANGIEAAATFIPENLPETPAFPLFVKPRRGRGGVGAFAIRDQRELDFFLGYVPGAVVQEFLEGPEFTIDMLCDFTGRPLSIVPRERVVIRAGVIDRGRTVRNAQLTSLAEACARVLPFAGAVNIQCRVVRGRPVVFEINPRFSGGIPLTIEAGADFTRMLVDLAAGRPVAPSIGAYRDNLWMTNYETSVFLDGSRVSLDAFQPSSIAEVA